MSDLAASLWLSLRIAAASTVLTALVALPLASLMARRRFRGKSLLDALIIVPLVLPPTVVGYLLIVTLGANGWVGSWLDRVAGYKMMFRFEGAVLAAAVVSLPMLYLPARAALADVDRDLEETARLMGAGRLRTFWHVTLPLARRGIASGAILAFARALGEFGATVMFYGWSEHRLTLPISVYTHYTDGNGAMAAATSAVLAGVSLALIAAYNASAVGRQD
jgi:molybdate transport system permease protein